MYLVGEETLMKPTAQNHLISEAANSFAYLELLFASWDALKLYLLNFASEYSDGSYVFRGHADASWKLEPTIDRLGLKDTIAAEARSIADFEKDVAIFSGTKDISFLNMPATDLQWLALMQHHGAATRLLDFSDSPFIAAFFAMANISASNRDKCIWAIPLDVIDKKNLSIIDDRSQTLTTHYEQLKIDKNRKPDILGYSYLDKQFERLFRQQGGFLYSLSSSRAFLPLLVQYFDDASLKSIPLLKLTVKNVSKTEVGHAIRDLKSMNITYSSLFPDIDGFSKDILLTEYIGEW